MDLRLPPTVAVIGTGGTIAGQASDPNDHLGYQAGVLAAADLVRALPALARWRLQVEQVAQIDSKDMGYSTWRVLAMRCALLLADPAIGGIVVTHGTDTIEETAFFLHAVLTATKPVVLTCAMRPASASFPDGPQNLLDAVRLASASDFAGVVVSCAGAVHAARDVRKSHTYRLDAFSSGDAGAMAYMEADQVRWVRNKPVTQHLPGQHAMQKIAKLMRLPRVEWLTSHADADGTVLDALMAFTAPIPLAGLVVAGTGNGTVHAGLERALDRARAAGIRIVRATRCAEGRVLRSPAHGLDTVWDLTPSKARIALALELAGVNNFDTEPQQTRVETPAN